MRCSGTPSRLCLGRATTAWCGRSSRSGETLGKYYLECYVARDHCVDPALCGQVAYHHTWYRSTDRSRRSSSCAVVAQAIVPCLASSNSAPTRHSATGGTNQCSSKPPSSASGRGSSRRRSRCSRARRSPGGTKVQHRGPRPSRATRNASWRTSTGPRTRARGRTSTRCRGRCRTGPPATRRPTTASTRTRTSSRSWWRRSRNAAPQNPLLMRSSS